MKSTFYCRQASQSRRNFRRDLLIEIIRGLASGAEARALTHLPLAIEKPQWPLIRASESKKHLLEARE